MFTRPPRGAGNNNAVSNRGGTASSAVERPAGQRDLAAGPLRLGQLDRRAVADRPVDGEDPGATVDVAALEREEFLGPQSGRGGERRQRPVCRAHFGADRVELGAGVGADGPRRRTCVKCSYSGSAKNRSFSG